MSLSKLANQVGGIETEMVLSNPVCIVNDQPHFVSVVVMMREDFIGQAAHSDVTVQPWFHVCNGPLAVVGYL